MKYFLSVSGLIAFSLVACSGRLPLRLKQTEPVELSLSVVERLYSQKPTKDPVKQTLGNPAKIVPLSDQEELWVYQESTTQTEPRLSLVFSQDTGLLLTAAWLPKRSDALRKEQAALAHFQNAHFELQDVGWIAKHSYSHEATYSDSARGISLRLNKQNHTISVIGFSQPAPLAIATQKSKQ